eukprot:732421-Amphidinium_carterae.1
MLIFLPLNIKNIQKTFYHHQVLNNHHQSTLTFIQHQKQWLNQTDTSLDNQATPCNRGTALQYLGHQGVLP